MRETAERLMGMRRLFDFFFDADWYVAANPDVRASGAACRRHYRSVGLRENRAPGPLFDPQWYLTANTDVQASGVPAFRHFARRGLWEGRLPGRWAEPFVPAFTGTPGDKPDFERRRLELLMRASARHLALRDVISGGETLPAGLSMDDVRWFRVLRGPHSIRRGGSVARPS